MSDISEFPTIQQVLWTGDNIGYYTAGEDIKAGQVVGIAASGTSMTVVVMDDTDGENALGIAIYGVDSGDLVAVAEDGCVCYVANADDTTGIDAGDWVEQNNNSEKGTVSAFSPRDDMSSTTIDASDDTTVDGSARIVGLALDDIAGDGIGRIKVKPSLILYSDHTVV